MGSNQFSTIYEQWNQGKNGNSPTQLYLDYLPYSHLGLTFIVPNLIDSIELGNSFCSLDGWLLVFKKSPRDGEA